MSESDLPPTRLSDPLDAEVTRYKAVSPLAVIGLIVGLLSFVAVLNPSLVFIPALGVALSGAALVRIRRDPEAFTGHTMAVAGLLLSVLFVTAGQSQRLVHRWLIRREAREFSDAWFELLRRGEPHYAHQLTRHEGDRYPLDDQLRSRYAREMEQRRDLQQYMENSVVQTLLALGEKAQARYYDTERYRDEGDRELLDQIYAVTYAAPDGKKTFFVALELERSYLHKPDRAGWRVVDVQGGVHPEAYGGGEEDRSL